jgi:FkbM family methyltransferase
MLKIFKKSLKNMLNIFNYEIRKYPKFKYKRINIFQMIIENYMMRNNNNCLYFLQVGANDGRSNDPINYYIKKYGWKGILIEPQKKIFSKLKNEYKKYKQNVIFENIAISSTKGEIELYVPKSEKKNSAASVKKNIVKNQLKLGSKSLENYKVNCMTIEDLIKKHSIKKIDLLQIDAEGYDFEVLKTLSMKNIKPKIIHFEHGHLTPRDCNNVTIYLSKHNYSIYWGGSQGDSIAIL